MVFIIGAIIMIAVLSFSFNTKKKIDGISADQKRPPNQTSLENEAFNKELLSRLESITEESISLINGSVFEAEAVGYYEVAIDALNENISNIKFCINVNKYFTQIDNLKYKLNAEIPTLSENKAQVFNYERDKDILKDILHHLGRDTFIKVTRAKVRGEKVFISDEQILEAIKQKKEDDREKFILSETSRLNNLGIRLERELEIDTAVSVYEENIAYRYPATHSYERLAALYRLHKDIANEKRVLEIAIEVFTLENKRKYKAAIMQHPDITEEITTAHRNNEMLKGADGWVILNPYNVTKYIKRLNKIERL